MVHLLLKGMESPGQYALLIQSLQSHLEEARKVLVEKEEEIAKLKALIEELQGNVRIQ